MESLSNTLPDPQMLPANRIKPIILQRNVVIATHSTSIKPFYCRHWKYVSLYHFNIGSYYYSLRMSRALRRIKYLAKLGNVVLFNTKKAKAYEEAFKSSYKTTRKFQNRFSYSSKILGNKYYKYVNRLVKDPLFLHERYTKVPIPMLCQHKNLKYLCIGKSYSSITGEAEKELHFVLSRLKKLETLKVSFETLDPLALYNILKAHGSGIKEILTSISGFSLIETPEYMIENQMKLPITHIKITTSSLRHFEVFHLYPGLFSELRSISIESIFSCRDFDPAKLYDIIKLPKLANIQLNFAFQKGNESFFCVLNHFTSNRPASLQKISAEMRSRNFLSESPEDTLASKPNAMSLKYEFITKEQKSCIKYNISFPRPNPFLDFLSTHIPANMTHLQLELDSWCGFVGVPKINKIINIMNLCSTLKSFYLKSHSLSLSKSLADIEVAGLEEVVLKVIEIKGFVIEQFESFLRLFKRLGKLRRFWYHTRQKPYNVEICQAISYTIKGILSMEDIEIELDAENVEVKGVQDIIGAVEEGESQRVQTRVVLLNVGGEVENAVKEQMKNNVEVLWRQSY